MEFVELVTVVVVVNQWFVMKDICHQFVWEGENKIRLESVYLVEIEKFLLKLKFFC